MQPNPININPNIQGGTPVFRGTRVPIKALFDYLEAGDDIDAFLNDFPSVTREQAIQIIHLAEKSLASANTFNENPA
jgi:uncharacterized protein (DUF433 family)